MTNRLVEILYFLSTGLLLPVLVVLIASMASQLMTLGGLFREAFDRRRVARSWRGFLLQLREDSVEAEQFYRLRLTGYAARFQRETGAIRENRLAVRKSLEDIEIAVGKRLARLSIQTRVGPMLGLVGTLLPLGPALTGLASGNVQALAGNLIIAFTTTVFGILVGAFAYAVSLIRRAWYEQDLSDLEFVVNVLYASDHDSNSIESSSCACQEYKRA
jgi:biopolymer transport protein ExbB/TolQ